MSRESKTDQNQINMERKKIKPWREGLMKGGRNNPPTTPRPASPPGLNIKKNNWNHPALRIKD